jgi:hypothetical protein
MRPHGVPEALSAHASFSRLLETNSVGASDRPSLPARQGSRRVPRSNGCDGCTRPAVRRRSRAAAAPRPWRRMRS